MLKRIAIGAGALLGMLVLALTGAYAVGNAKVNRTYEVQTAALTIPTDSASIARGAHLVEINGCRDCHGQDLSGQVVTDAPPFRITAANLTAGKGGVGGRYSAADLDRAVRHGIKPDGRSVLIMPSAAYHGLSDRDMAAMIAYLQQIPPVDGEYPPTEVRLMGRLLSAGPFDPAFEVRTEPARADMPEPGPTAEYGEYLAGVCAYCHGANLEGMETPPGPPGMIPAPPLVASGHWTFDEFATALRTGVRPNGREIDAKFMPLAITKHLTDEELRALHLYIAARTGAAAATAQANEGA